MENKIINWNVNGLNDQKKRNIIFKWIQKQNCVICGLQETHINNKDRRLLIKKNLGEEFYTLMDKKKRGTILYIKKELEPKMRFKDEEGRLVAVEVKLYGQKTSIVNAYAPNGSKEIFFMDLKKRLEEENYEHLILLGDFNGVIDLKMDKLSPKKNKSKMKGKLPQVFYDLTKQENISDIWRDKNPGVERFYLLLEQTLYIFKN